jgi:hypothetical protein
MAKSKSGGGIKSKNVMRKPVRTGIYRAMLSSLELRRGNVGRKNSATIQQPPPKT